MKDYLNSSYLILERGKGGLWTIEFTSWCSTTGQKIQDIGIPNPFMMLNPFELVPMIHKSFFTEEDMEPGEVKQKGDKVNLNDPNRPVGVTNMSTVTTVKLERGW